MKAFIFCMALVPIAVHYELSEVGAILVIAGILLVNVIKEKRSCK